MSDDTDHEDDTDREGVERMFDEQPINESPEGIREPMRSTNDIMIAVQECELCTEEELRLCIASLQARLYFAEKAADDMAEAIERGADGKMAAAQLRAGFWKNEAEPRFKSIKMPVDEYLGPGNTPGTPEQVERLQVAKAVVKKATGVNL